MAKITAQTAVNDVLTKIGEPTVSGLTSLTGIELLAFNTLNELIYSIGAESMWQPLETFGTITMTSNTATYAEPTDMVTEDKDSFIVPDNSDTITLLTPQEWASLYPKGVSTSTVGWPTALKREQGYWFLNKTPGATQNTKTVQFRYFKIPTIYTTATATGTCWFPEGMDYAVLCNLATYRLLHYKGSPEAQYYRSIVYGTGPNDEGSLATMRKRYVYSAGRLKVRVTEPL